MESKTEAKESLSALGSEGRMIPSETTELKESAEVAAVAAVVDVTNKQEGQSVVEQDQTVTSLNGIQQEWFLDE